MGNYDAGAKRLSALERPSIRSIRTFVTVAEAGGIAKAADVLGYSQPAVTLQVQRLERFLGSSLFERAGRKVVLSPAGRNALEPAKALLKEVDGFRQRVREKATYTPERISIGAIEPAGNLLLGPIFASLRRRRPKLLISVLALGGDDIARAAAERRIDIAITVPTEVRGWAFEPLLKERLVALLRPDHSLASQKSLALSRLCAEPLVLTDDTCAYRRVVEQAATRYGLVARVATETPVSSLATAVHAGLGAAIAPRHANAAEWGLREVAIREKLEITFGLLRPAQYGEETAVGQFIQAALEAKRRRS